MEEGDLDIAAAMGFSSFGGNKKRKHDLTDSPKSKPDASGANSTQLGVRTKKAVTPGNDQSTSSIPSFAQDPAPRYTKDASKSSHSAGLADFLARGHDLPEPQLDLGQNGRAGTQQQILSEASAEKTISFGGPMISRAELNALRFGLKNEAGDIAYFKPSFLDDPWRTS